MNYKIEIHEVSKYFYILFLMLIVSLPGVSYANKQIFNVSMMQDLGMDQYEINKIQEFTLMSDPILNNLLLSSYREIEDEYDEISDFETFLPHATNAPVSDFERALLTRYLDKPSDQMITKILALINLSGIGRYSNDPSIGSKIKHKIQAMYFLNRLQDQGGASQWVSDILINIDRQMSELTPVDAVIDLSEDHLAHKYFVEAFSYQEQNRYLSSQKLLDDFARAPNSQYTTFALTALHSWVGGEAEADDPTVLYDFILGSYFSVITIQQAKSAEMAWADDPINNQRFRLASILGGFSALERRWLANLHGDTAAVLAINDEHRAWLNINPVFHSFTLGLQFYEAPENFYEALTAWEEGFAVCIQQPEVRTCMDRPRFSFNPPAMLVGYADFLMKIGEAGSASFFLDFASQHPSFNDWDLGQEPWQHRVDNMDSIIDRYQNDDPSDDPLHLFMKKRKWGENTASCQLCHQAQSREWSDEERNTIILPTESYATIGSWPDVTTTWYGSSVE